MRQRLGDTLVAWGRITQEELADALSQQRDAAKRERLGRILLQRGSIDEVTLAAALAAIHGLPAANLDTLPIDPVVARMLPKTVTERFTILPIARTADGITVAVADPVDVVALDELKARLHGERTHVVVAPETQIRKHLDLVWGDESHREAVERFVEELPGAAEPELDETDTAGEAGSITLVNEMLATAARRRASDIHVEPLRNGVRVRLRIDGVLREMVRLPRSSLAPVTSRLKIVSNLDVMERRLPQDGRTRLEIDGQRRNIRVSSLPTIHGEKLVLRLLPTQEQLATLDLLGMTEEQHRGMVHAMHQPQGFVLVTGPTGAGKSNTLYAAMTEVIDEERNVITLEDPVEVELAGVTQVQINEVIGMTFDRGLRAVLRQDPDVVMVGEIRDVETANLAVRAALTGHLVLSTLHTLDAPQSIVRLIEMGVPRYLVATSLTLILAQRLVRQPCPQCVAPLPPDADTSARLGLTPEQAARMVAGRGCTLCEGSGYRGRTAVFEMLKLDRPMRETLLDPEIDEASVRAAARRSGWIPLLERGIDMACEGETTAAELLRNLVTDAAGVD